MGNWYQGEYKILNKEKYVGDKPPIYRSSWERKVFHYLDTNTNVINWASENIIIPYFFPIDNKTHKYYPDVYCKVKDRDGSIKEVLIEIKPHSQSVKPRPPRIRSARAMKNYKNLQITVLKNKFKWEAAKHFCNKKGWEFKVITERDLFNN